MHELVRRFLRTGALALALLGIHGLSFSAPLPVKDRETFTLSKSGSGTYSVSPISAGGVPVSRAITSGSVLLGTGSVNVLETFSATGAAGKSLSLDLSRTIDWDHVAGAGALGLAATRSPWGAAAGAAYDLWDQLRVKPDGNGGALRDVGASPGTEVQTIWEGSYNGSVCRGATSTAAMECLAAKIQAGGSMGAWKRSGGVGWAPPGNDTSSPYGWCIYATYYKPDGTPDSSHVNECWGVSNPSPSRTTAEVDKPCPNQVSPGLDGKCATGVFTPVTPDQLKSALNDPKVQPFAQARAPDLVKDAVQQGVAVDPQQQSLSGPSSQTGTPVTSSTTNPDGTTLTKTETPVYNYTYSNGDTVQYSVTTTNVVNNNGTTTTTTTTTSGGSGSPPSDICKDNPGISACAELGAAAVPPSLGEEAWDPSLTPDAPILSSGGGGCPAPITISVPHVPTFVISWQPLCDMCSLIKPLVLMLASFGALRIFVGGFRV